MVQKLNPFLLKKCELKQKQFWTKELLRTLQQLAVSTCARRDVPSSVISV